MEELSKLINNKSSNPKLWIELINIYNSPKPEDLIRSISLRPGINIIWAKEPEQGSAVGIHANGHGVGKTSLCQLMRYCLGDSAKTVTDLRDELQREFPNGGVAAVIHLNEKIYSVFRFYNPHKDGWVLSSSQIDDLFGDSLTDNYKHFESHLSDVIMSEISPRIIPDTGQAIEWRHLLAWMTRDQGTRFKSYFSWREGEGTGLQRSRQDPPIVMRATLGLMEQNESNLISEITRLEREHSQSIQKTSQLRHEPELIRKRIESELRTFLGVNDEIPFQSVDLFSESVEGELKSVSEKSTNNLATIDAEISLRQSELVDHKAAWLLKKQEYDKAVFLYEFAEAAKNKDEKALSELLNQKEKLMNLVGDCEHGAISFKECNHIQNELAKLNTVSLQSKRDQNLIATFIEQWAEKAEQRLNRKQAIKIELDQIDKNVQEKEREAGKLRIKRDTAALQASRAEQLLNELNRWRDNSGSIQTKYAIEETEQYTNTIAEKINSKNLGLRQIKQNRSSREKTLYDLTDHLTRELLASEAFGAFEMRDEEQPFKLSIRGGEAYRVMEILLGDLVCLFDSSNSASAFPGFIIHDCPREADMSSGMYEKFFLLIERAEREIFNNSAPYQYIVTTTTPPPVSMQKLPYLRETLDPSIDIGLLFKTRFNNNSQ